MNDDLNAQLHALATQAARAFDAAQKHYSELRPEDHAAFCTLVEAGARPFVTIAPLDGSIEVGFVHAGSAEVIYRCKPEQPSGAPN